MSVRNHLRLIVLALLVATGCAEAPEDHPAVVSRAEWETLPRGCDKLLDLARDEAVVVSFADQTRNAVVLDTPNGSCVDTQEHLTDVLEERERFSLLARVRNVLVGADPSPHPDIPTNQAGHDPSPHPDANGGDEEADPSPHPDKDDDATVVVVIVIQVGSSAEEPKNANKPD